MKTPLFALAFVTIASAQNHAIDTQKSVMMVRVYKSGIFSAFAHDHDIGAPIKRGSADIAAKRVDLHVDSAALVVRDEKGSEKDHSEIQKTMLGPEVLDSARFPEIVFRSTAVEPSGPGVWRVQGTLTLHGQTKPIVVAVTEKSGRYLGHALLKQTDFGIKPVKVAGGTVRVKDEIRIEFDIQLAR